jgi:hypothetical protein
MTDHMLGSLLAFVFLDFRHLLFVCSVHSVVGLLGYFATSRLPPGSIRVNSTRISRLRYLFMDIEARLGIAG